MRRRSDGFSSLEVRVKKGNDEGRWLWVRELDERWYLYVC